MNLGEPFRKHRRCDLAQRRSTATLPWKGSVVRLQRAGLGDRPKRRVSDTARASIAERSEGDRGDGSLDLIFMARAPLELAMAVKALAHWLTTGVPLVIASPLLGLLLNLDPTATGAVALTLAAGTPALTFIGMIGAALTVTLRRGGLLLAVLVLPLTVPVLIFGVAAANAAITGPMPLVTPL